MSMDPNLIERIEAQRRELEANIAKLRKSLHHWTTLELDYEGLKDEFQTLQADATKADCLRVAHDFAPQKVNEKEINELIEPSRGKNRSPAQIVELLSKRIEYVLRNTESLKKQISDLEKKRNAVLLAAHPEHEAEATLPLTEITEELDDDGNVLSSNVQQQGDTAKKVLDVLQKTKVQPEGSRPTVRELSAPSHSRIEELDNSEDDSDEPYEAGGVPNDATTQVCPTNPDDNEEEAHMRQEMINYGLGEVGNIVAELELADAQDGALEHEDESMLDDADVNEDEDEYDDSDESMEEESEDESGRSKATIHTEKYRKQMEELQKQLGLKMENIGPSPETIPNLNAGGQINYMRDTDFTQEIEHLPPEFRKRFGRLSPAQAARQAAIAREEASRNSPSNAVIEGKKPAKSNKSKKVAFASTVDIAPAPSTTKSAVMNDTITENSAMHTPLPESAPSAKVSRFKATRAAQPQTLLYPPPLDTPLTKTDDRLGPASGKTIVKDLIERSGTSSTKNAPPPDADDFDEELQRRQIALEHHKLRNKIVHEQGGYVRGGEAENWGDAYAAPKIEDEETGEPVKISRFKAARLRP